MKNHLYILFILLSINTFAQFTAIPDANFEQALIDDGHDTEGVINGQILTADAEAVECLFVTGESISDLTEYCAGESARNNMLASDLWNITDGDLVCSSFQHSINYMSTANGAIVGDGTTNTDYFGPNNYGGDYGDCTSGNWEWIHALCSECSINDIDVSVKQNNHNGSTWYAGGGASRYMVIDLSMSRTFNELRVFQMFSDGKVTSLKMYSHSDMTTVPIYTDADWTAVFAETPINAGMIAGNTVSLPTVINFPYTTSRFLLIEAKNDGSFGYPTYTEIRELKLFDNDSSDPAPIDIFPLVDTMASQNVCVSYMLPPLTNGNYFTGTGGTGTALFADAIISSNQTIYIYADNGTCTNETSFTVTIIADVTNPITPTLADVTGGCTATATVPTTTDDCAGTITGTTADPLTYTTEGTYVITWNFDDGNGNSIDVTQNVILDDITNPITPTLADVIGECTATATPPTTTDNCAGTITGTTTDPLSYTTTGTHVITWTFDDGNGNSIDVTQNVIIDDITNPITPTLTDVTGECTATATPPTTTDDCTGTITGTTTDPLTYTTTGTHSITWTFDDGNGNSIDVTQNVIIDDVTNPITPTLADVTGECTATATVPTTTDDCAGTITGTTTDPLTYTTTGTHSITWTFDDGNGNSIEVIQNVIIDDITNPITPTLNDVTGECTATATVPTTTDNCAGTITGTTTDPLTYTTTGTHSITWTFDDGNGNSIEVIQNVIIDDSTNPITPTLTDVTGECTATATPPTTTDNCAGTITGTTADPLTYTTAGTHSITWTFDDGNGNSIDVIQNVIIAVYDATISEVGPFCVMNDEVALTAVDSGGIWAGAGITDADTGAFNPSVADVGTHTITYIISGSCGDTSTIEIIVNPLPEVEELDDITANNYYELPILFEGNYYTESNGGGAVFYSGDEITESMLLYIYIESEDDPAPCFSESSFSITIVPYIDYMDFFTPNGNGENDYWQVLGAERVKQGTKINIFDRFGKLVAQIDPHGMGWDGLYNGQALPSSDYWFNVTLIDGTEMKGNFSLLRK